MEPDFYYRNESSIILLFPITKQAQKWVLVNLALETWQDPDQVAIDLKLWDDIAAGILIEGMTIEVTE